MRISSKLTLGLALVSTCILGAYGYWQYAQEKADLREAALRNFTTLSAAVRVAIENSLRDTQNGDIREILDSVEVGEPEIDVFVIDAAGNVAANSSQGADSAEDAAAVVAALGLDSQLADPETQSLVRFEERTGTPRLVGLFPLWNDGFGRIGAIAIVRPLPALAADLRRTRNSAIVSSLTLIGGITFVGWLLLLVSVRWPLERLNAAMRAVREGDLSRTVPERGRDELAAMAQEFNAMLRQLEQARRQLMEAAESRELLEHALQHADKLITVGQLSAGLAHEIGSPLQVLSGRARALASRTDLPTDVTRTARILDEQSARIAGIVEQLLAFARRKEPHMADIDFGGATVVIVDLLEAEARRRGVHLEYRCPPALPQVTADANQVQQLVMNLLTNALRATPHGGRVRVSLAESSFTSASGVPDQLSVALTVEDSGHGMPDLVQRRMFEPFFTTWAEAGGSGLGMAVVKSIVDDHGGAIVVTSAKDQGTAVVVHLAVAGRMRLRGVVA